MPYTESDFTPDFCVQLYRDHGTIEAAAQAIAPQCESSRFRGRPVVWKTVRHWIREGVKAANGGVGINLSRPADPERLNRIDDLLDRANIPIDEIGGITGARLKAYSGFIKNKDGEAERVPMYSTSFDLVPREPKWPIVDRPDPIQVIYPPVPRILRKTWSAVIVSDVQFGYLVNPETRAIETIHDVCALDICKQITHDVQPQEWVSIGDFVDWPFLSRWQQHDEYDAPNETIRGAHRELAELKSAAGKKCQRFRVIPSNHGDRPEKFLLEHNRIAKRIRRATDTSGWPVFSEPYLLCFDDLGLVQEGHYPGGEYYLLPELVLMHAPPKVREFNASVIHGHTHHLTMKTTPIHGHDGRRAHFIYDIGCLCALETYTDKHSLITLRVPSDRPRTDWAQGFAVVNVVDGKFPFHSVDQIKIDRGQAFYGGKHYATGNPEAA